MTYRRCADETGSALVLALVFLSLFGLFISVLLSFADTGIRTTMSLRDHDARLYAADGAMDGALLYVRDEETRGREGQPCPNFSMTSTNDVPVVVECTPQPGSGAVLVGGGDNSANKPQQAVLTLSQAGEDGIFVQNNTNPAVPLNIAGGVRSNSNINVTSGSMTVEGDVRAAGACSGPITATGVKLCSTGNVVGDPGASNSGYNPRTSTRPPEVPVPACPSAGSLTMPPGTYTDAAALSALTSSCNRTIIFQGVYYFDFKNTTTVTCGTQTAPHLWCVLNGSGGFNIIGGTPDPANPGECLPSGTGVQFIFGGDSRVSFQAGKARICAFPETTRQRIAVYAKEGPEQPLPPLETFPPINATLESNTITTNSGNPKFGSGGPANALVNAKTVDGTVTSVTLAKGTDAWLNFADYAPVIPSDGTVNTVKLRLRHREPPIARVDRLTVQITNGNGKALPPIPSRTGPTCLPETMLCLSESLRIYDPPIIDPDFNEPSEINGANVRVSYFARSTNGDSVEAAVDGAVFDVNYTPKPVQPPRPPPFPTQSGCVIATGTTNIQTCSLISTDGSNTDVRINGTIYAPKSAVLIKSVNNGSQIIGRGLISRALRVELPGSAGLNDAPIQIPPDSGGANANRSVVFTAKVGGEPRLRARVDYDDSVSPPAMTVHSWAVLR